MIKVELSYISSSEAKGINDLIKRKGGIAVNNRILVMTPEANNTKTSGGLYVPDTADKETLPRKGVVVQVPNIPVEIIKEFGGYVPAVGDIVTYGLYAGKEVDIITYPNNTLTILSLNEVLYIEKNPNK
jgi:co-chaperonin GroES (HSP10)